MSEEQGGEEMGKDNKKTKKKTKKTETETETEKTNKKKEWEFDPCAFVGLLFARRFRSAQDRSLLWLRCLRAELFQVW